MTDAARPIEIRDTLFGDLPLDAWPAPGGADASPPWSDFAAARAARAAGERDRAIQLWRDILVREGLESRHHLQAWHFLRQEGRKPPPEVAKTVLGVVVEVRLAEGLDIVAAYRDGSARYYNYSGAAVAWERPDASLDPLVNALLAAGEAVVRQIGPWDGERPPAPPEQNVRLSMLTPSGLHFGQGPLQTLAGDALGGPVIRAALELMQALIDRTPETPPA